MTQEHRFVTRHSDCGADNASLCNFEASSGQALGMGAASKRNRSCRSVQIIPERDRGHTFSWVSHRGRAMSLRGKLRFVGQTDTGKVREHNEDTIASDPDIGLLVLADGMGGYNAGEVASGIAVKTIVNLVRESVEREDMRVLDQATGMSRPSIILGVAILRPNRTIITTT